MPRTSRKAENDTRKHQVGQQRTAEMAPEGPAALEVEPIQVVDGPNFKSKAEGLKFMEDMLTIIVHPSAEKKPEDPVYVAVNGRGCYIWRNKKYLVKRKYVERLARAKVEAVHQDTEAKTPEEFNRLTITPALRYPFSVLHDPHPDGGAWLQKVLAEG